MKPKIRVVPAPPATSNETSLGRRLRAVVAMRAEEILAEVAPTIRHVRTFLLVLTISIPLFMVGLLAALWHLGH
jgi:hypothetical protein